MTRKEIIALLEDEMIEFEPDAPKNELEALLPENLRETEKQIDTRVKITASYLVVERDTNITSRQTYEGEGKTVADALDKLNFPPVVNCLVNTKIETDKGTIEKALAPHKARQILGSKNVALFNVTYRGFV